MKLLATILTVSIAVQTVFAISKEERLQNGRSKRTATALLQTGDATAAWAHLKQNVRPEAGPKGDTIALVQALIEMAGRLYNQRNLNLARESATQAFFEAQKIMGPGAGASDRRQAELYVSLGALQELVMFDLPAAQRLYEAAGALQPADELIKRRKSAVRERQNVGGGTR